MIWLVIFIIVIGSAGGWLAYLNWRDRREHEKMVQRRRDVVYYEEWAYREPEKPAHHYGNTVGGEEQVGGYVRNYNSLYRTFWHFVKNGRDYALYSRDYTATRVMELPSCKDIGGEERDTWGFCPVDFYVPWENTEGDDPEFFEGNIGFVSGCIWGDDLSWKLQYLDLSEVEAGIIKRDDRFGYVELWGGIALQDAIYFYSWPNIGVATIMNFSLDNMGNISDLLR